MKRPKKKNTDSMNGFTGLDKRYYLGYNQACDDWEEYHKYILKKARRIAERSINSVVKKIGKSLPSEKEIRTICQKDKFCKECETYRICLKNNLMCKFMVAKAISKRIRGEK